MGIATRGSAIAIGICFPVIGGILVALRFYVRWHQKTSRQIDDWLCLPAWLFVTGCCVSLLIGVFKGAFVDQPVADPNSVSEQQRVLAQVTAALVIFFLAANALIKLSILFFYRRIFIGRIFTICNWILIGLSFLWAALGFLSWILYCGTNLHADFEGGWAACDPWGFDIQMGVFCLDTLIDFSILILPVPFVWRLHLNLSRKLIIAVIFLLGGFAFVAGLNNTIIQLVYLTKPSIADSGGQANFFQGSGLLFSNWPAIEVGVGLIACNLPSLSFQAIHVLPRQIRQGWNLSLSGIRHAVERLSLRSDPRRTQTDTHLTKIGDDGTASDWYNSRRGSSHIPLVHLESKANVSSETRPVDGQAINGYIPEPTENGNGKVSRGFDAV